MSDTQFKDTRSSYITTQWVYKKNGRDASCKAKLMKSHEIGVKHSICAGQFTMK